MLARLLCFFSYFCQNKPCFGTKKKPLVGVGAHDDPQLNKYCKTIIDRSRVVVGANPYPYAFLHQIKYKKSSAWIAELFVFYT